MTSTAESGVGSSHGEALTTSAIIAEAATGSHVLQINGYSLTVGLGTGKFIKSSTFSVGGHRWYIRYYPDGELSDCADWISIFLQHDSSGTAAEVKARSKFSLLDGHGEPVQLFSLELETSMSTFSSENPCWGFRKFVKRISLEDSTYLNDDFLRVRCDVTVAKDIRTEATTRFVVVPPSNMHQHFGGLLQDAAVGADVAFEVAGEVFHAHRCMLAARSSVFMAELYGHMKEKAMARIRIQDMEARVFKAMLHFIYTDTDAMPDNIDKDEAFVITQHLLVAADRYDLGRLKLICEDKLCNCIDTSTVVTTLALAERHGCHGLKMACFDFLKSASHLKSVMATEGFDRLMTTCPLLSKELLAMVVTTTGP